MEHQHLYTGLIRLHILHHAAEEPIFGLGIIEELSRHGYRLSAGTLYPLLHGLEAKGYLRSFPQKVGRRYRRTYEATPLGREALASAKDKVRELVGELFEEGGAAGPSDTSVGRLSEPEVAAPGKALPDKTDEISGKD